MVRHATKQASRSWCSSQSMSLHVGDKGVTALRTKAAKHGTLCTQAIDSQLFAQCRNATECWLQCMLCIQHVSMSNCIWWLFDAWAQVMLHVVHMTTATCARINSVCLQYIWPYQDVSMPQCVGHSTTCSLRSKIVSRDTHCCRNCCCSSCSSRWCGCYPQLGSLHVGRMYNDVGIQMCIHIICGCLYIDWMRLGVRLLIRGRQRRSHPASSAQDASFFCQWTKTFVAHWSHRPNSKCGHEYVNICI